MTSDNSLAYKIVYYGVKSLVILFVLFVCYMTYKMTGPLTTRTVVLSIFTLSILSYLCVLNSRRFRAFVTHNVINEDYVKSLLRYTNGRKKDCMRLVLIELVLLCVYLICPDYNATLNFTDTHINLSLNLSLIWILRSITELLCCYYIYRVLVYLNGHRTLRKEIEEAIKNKNDDSE